MATVTLSKLNKVYGAGKDAFHAVKAIDLEVADREFMVLVGPSGCGKSTTLRMIAGLEEISGGVLKIGDQVMNDVQPKDRGIAMVFQNYALYPHMTVFNNMAFGLKLKGHPKAEILEKVNNAASILGLESMLDRKPKALSGGQRQRVALGRAIVRDPAVFLFDEPLSNLDAKMRVQMRTEISKLHNRLNATMVYVTHDQVEAMTMGDRICVMKDGHIMQLDTPMNIYNNPANMFVAGFIGSPPMNFLEGRIEQDGGRLEFVEGAAGGQGARIQIDPTLLDRARKVVGRNVVFGVRPENLSAVESANDAHFSAIIDVVEPMGAETFLYLQTTTGQSLIARVEGDHSFKPGAVVPMRCDQEKAHLFDAESEAVIL